MTTLDFSVLHSAPRLLLEARLKPAQGERFQPTGFADLGPAEYELPDEAQTKMLLLESAQSVANRMEVACCDDDKRSLLTCLSGLPYVKSTRQGTDLTTSYLEAHRLSSPYLLTRAWAEQLAGEMQLQDDFDLNYPQIAKAIFKYDPASLLHGVWLSAKEYKDVFSGGRVRVTRALSGFIEASNVRPAFSGGTKFDRNSARMSEEGDAKTGYGTIPFSRREFVAERVVAYFNLDLALLRGYKLEQEAVDLLIALSLFKVQRFLTTGLRLRTACVLELVDGIQVVRPEKFALPSLADLERAIQAGIKNCTQKELFANPSVTTLEYRI